MMDVVISLTDEQYTQLQEMTLTRREISVSALAGQFCVTGMKSVAYRSERSKRVYAEMKQQDEVFKEQGLKLVELMRKVKAAGLEV